MLIAHRASICLKSTSWSIGTPKPGGAGYFCSEDTFHILNRDGFALKIKAGHVVQGEGGSRVQTLRFGGV